MQVKREMAAHAHSLAGCLCSRCFSGCQQSWPRGAGSPEPPCAARSWQHRAHPLQTPRHTLPPQPATKLSSSGSKILTKWKYFSVSRSFTAKNKRDSSLAWGPRPKPACTHCVRMCACFPQEVQTPSWCFSTVLGFGSVYLLPSWGAGENLRKHFKGCFKSPKGCCRRTLRGCEQD